MTKLLAINSSHRGEKGYTQFLVDKIFSGAKKAGAECETIVLANHKINACLGCRACHKKNHYLKCVYDEKDDVKMIFDKMREADILIYATPIYIFSMTGLMKIFLDRITSTADSSIMTLSDCGLFFHHIDRKLVSKPFVLLTTQDNLENETSASVVSYFKSYSGFLDAPIAGIIRRKSGALVGHGRDTENENRYPKIKSVYEAIEMSGFELIQNGKISAKTQKAASQSIVNMPGVVAFLLRSGFVRKSHFIMSRIFEQAKLKLNNLDYERPDYRR